MDPRVRRIIVAPGNDFVAYKRQKEVIIAKDCSLKDPSSLLAVANKYKPDLVDVNQDNALGLGTVDLLKENSFVTFGPTRKAARIEWDKAWSREFMVRNGIPAPHFLAYNLDEIERAKEDVRALYESNPDALLYVKAAGLCEGKGALRCTSLQEALYNIERMKSFGEAGKRFVIEDGMTGEEFSYVGISDGRTFRGFKKPAQDNKLSENFDRGEQTGGMGANAPALVALPLVSVIESRIMVPAIQGMADEDKPYVGILYLGGIYDGHHPKVVEFNARFPDPEDKVIPVHNYPDLVFAALHGRLHELEVVGDEKYRWCVVGAARGYPNRGEYAKVKGRRIHGLDEAAKLPGVKIYGAGIAVRNNRHYVDGGRLFNVVAEGNNPLDAKQRAYEAMSYINIEGNNLHFRIDVGWRDIDRFVKSFES